MNGIIAATIHVAWDEEGNVAAHVDAGEAADLLDAMSNGRFRRVAAITLTLPSAGPVEVALDVPDDGARPLMRHE